MIKILLYLLSIGVALEVGYRMCENDLEELELGNEFEKELEELLKKHFGE